MSHLKPQRKVAFVILTSNQISSTRHSLYMAFINYYQPLPTTGPLYFVLVSFCRFVSVADKSLKREIMHPNSRVNTMHPLYNLNVAASLIVSLFISYLCIWHFFFSYVSGDAKNIQPFRPESFPQTQQSECSSRVGKA